MASNIATIIFALIFNWGLITLMWGYWIQSVTIGFFNFLKIISMSLRLEKAFEKGQEVFLALFFAIHYGGFHFGYFVFLLAFSIDGIFGLEETVDVLGVLIIGILFFFNHTYSFWMHTVQLKEENVSPAKIQEQFGKPYARIIPMHLTIIFCG